MNTDQEFKKNIVSIIIPVYNIENYIVKCIKSVVTQSYNNLEIIVVDDGSTDNSIQKIKQIKDNRIKIFHKENGGLSSARNFGLKKAIGEYIFFLDGDDYLDKNAINNLVIVSSINDVDIVQGEACYYYSNGYYKIDKIKEGVIENDITLEYFKTKNFKTYVWNKLYSHKFIKGLKFQEKMTNEDIAFSYDVCLKKPRVINLNKVIYFYVQRENSIVHNKKLSEKLKVLEAHDYVISRTDDKYKRYALFHEYRSCLYMLSDCCMDRITYQSEEMLFLKRKVYELKKQIGLLKYDRWISNKDYLIYIFSLMPLEMFCTLFTAFRKKHDAWKSQ
ncbi:glycosyltransferase [Bilifractor sp. LCP21S3_A7]|uniref:glycosyltransferase n=1 Tax=Bilifractor sp. LCP21S3_A7 TaxID=3438738 RepID=UPI003F8F377F